MCTDLVYQTSELDSAIDNTYIAMAQSQEQRQLLADHPVDTPVFVEGGFITWLRYKLLIYFVLRADTTDEYNKALERRQKTKEDDSKTIFPRQRFLSLAKRRLFTLVQLSIGCSCFGTCFNHILAFATFHHQVNLYSYSLTGRFEAPCCKAFPALLGSTAVSGQLAPWMLTSRHGAVLKSAKYE